MSGGGCGRAACDCDHRGVCGVWLQVPVGPRLSKTVPLAPGPPRCPELLLAKPEGLHGPLHPAPQPSPLCPSPPPTLRVNQGPASHLLSHPTFRCPFLSDRTLFLSLTRFSSPSLLSPHGPLHPLDIPLVLLFLSRAWRNHTPCLNLFFHLPWQLSSVRPSD